MKKLLFVFAISAFAACGGGTSTEEKMDSTVEAQKDMIDSSAEVKTDMIDSTAEAKKDMLDSTANKMDSAAKH
jgi:hypothetical protein